MKRSLRTAVLCLAGLIMHAGGAQAQVEAAQAAGLNSADITCSTQDAEGYLWYGGKDTGLCRFDGYDTETFRSDRQNPHLLNSNDVLCITELKTKAEIWFGTKEGAYILRKRDYQLTPVEVRAADGTNELADKRISCMLTAADGSVWLSYRNQLLHLSSEAELTERFETTWEGKNRSISHMRFDSLGNLYAELWNGGVICVKEGRGKRQPEPTSLSVAFFDPSPSPTATEEEMKGHLDSVMALLAPRKESVAISWAKIPAGLDGSDREQIYIGSYHSLFVYDGKQVKLLQTDLDKVRSMDYSAKRHTLYLLSKARGICAWKDGQLTAVCDCTQFHHLRLLGDSALLLSDGMAGVSNLNLRTMVLSADSAAADVRPIVTAYATDGEKKPLGFGQRTLSLPDGTGILEIFLSTLDFEHASQVQFAYSLDNGRWTVMPMGEAVAKFASLRGGTHSLQVRATDRYGRWSEPATLLTIKSPTAWYASIWLWAAVVAALAGAVCLIFFRRKRRRQELPQPTQAEATAATAAEWTEISVADREFLDKAAAAVLANMVNSEYSVDALASDLCMSRANLHRKMRAITGLTPTDFIRNQRLERAAELLRTTSHTVNEISDMVGFSYASYFTKCFKKKYGVLPKDY
ncbi:MAG: helix-turn-helix domain-containing protein [Bacteroidaceae bacterium]|nr:helix-turn-helix domain-containing protein [Bacteroidaceae bacterium]